MENETILSDGKIKIRLIGCLQSPDGKASADEICVAGALGCFEEKSSYELIEELKELPKDLKEKRLERLCAETSGRGHGSVLDQSSFAFSIEDLPRAATLHLCLPEYLSHLQQSLRRADADRGVYIPDSILNSEFKNEVEDAMMVAFSFYDLAKNAGVPVEDARYPLPLATRTNIQTLGDPRELMHLHHMSRMPSVPDVSEEVVQGMIDKAVAIAPHIMKERERGYEVLGWRPSSQLFAKENSLLNRLISQKGESGSAVLLDHVSIHMTEEEVFAAVKGDEAQLANLKHIHFTFLVSMSLNAFHQATRQRTWHQSVQSIYDALKRNEFVVPPKVKVAGLEEKMRAVHDKMVSLAIGLPGKSDIPESDAILIAPQSLIVYDLIHTDGWNALHSIGKRTCVEAQWEICDLANQMAESIRKTGDPIGKWVYPQGVIYGKCPERNCCGLCDKILNEIEN